MQSKTISRVMSCVIIYPMELSPVPLSDPPENMTGSHIRFLFGLASDGVYMCPFCYQKGGSLLHCLSTLTRKNLAVSLCCTIPGVASAGRYPASCPAKPGLSSPGPFRSCQPRLHILLCQKRNIRQLIIIPQTLFLVHPQIADPTKPYKTAFHTSKQLPPTNSRRIEFLGISSIGTPTK